MIAFEISFEHSGLTIEKIRKGGIFNMSQAWDKEKI